MHVDVGGAVVVGASPVLELAERQDQQDDAYGQHLEGEDDQSCQHGGHHPHLIHERHQQEQEALARTAKRARF